MAYAKLRQWVFRQAQSKEIGLVLFLVAAAEAVFFPIPPEVFSVPLTVINKHDWVRYSLLITFGALIGSAIGYIVGFAFFDSVGAWLIDVFHLTDSVELIREQFREGVFLAMMTAAFTPIPLKIFALFGGFLHVPFGGFLGGVFIGRVVRSFLFGYISFRYGDYARRMLSKHFTIISIVFIALVVLAIVLM